MAVTCPACGGISHDTEFCDHCNADLLPPAGDLAPGMCPVSATEKIELSAEQRACLSRPEASITLGSGDQPCRVHWIARSAWGPWRDAVNERIRLTLPVLPPCRLEAEETGFWVLADASGQPAAPWTAHLADEPIADLRCLLTALKRLSAALEQLHAEKLTWLTFDPQEIEEVPESGAWRFTNLDVGVYPAGQVPESLQVTPAFASPEVARFRAADVGPATDVFHLGLFAYYWLAGLLPRGFPGKGLEAFGHALPPLRMFAPGVPPGISGVLARALTLEPRQRHATPAAFCAALGKALDRAEKRCHSTVPVSWEIGQSSRTGRAKMALDRDNEDYVFVRCTRNPERALVAIADGITTCDVGSGALASWITCLVLDNSFPLESSVESFPARIVEVCRRSSENLLGWALEKGYRDQLAAGRDLMGSTLLAGWLQGHTLNLANVGDSRAYLIAGSVVDQLTVDGDLGAELLASGVPPEEVRALGSMARGLRVCVGGCAIRPDGEPEILDEYCRPALTQWPLLPGDVLVLCSDGLVEEGAFLEPETLGEIVRSHPHLPAEALAVQLVEAADALQRLPSALEPDGFGDNITCIVIRIHEAP